MLAIKETFLERQDQSFLLKLASEVHSEWSQYTDIATEERLHPCFVQSLPHLVTRKGLATEYPVAYRSLVTIADKYGVRVFEDRRQKLTSVSNDKRKKMLLAVGLIMSMSVKQTVFAEELYNNYHLEHTVTQQDDKVILQFPFQS